MSEAGLKGLAQQYKLEQDHKRELDHKHKWVLGENPITLGHPSKRPVKVSRSNYTKHEFVFQQNKAAKMPCKRDPVFDTSDPSFSEEVTEASAAPEPDAGYTYSFDAGYTYGARRPSKGSQILGMALARAVDKFETKATEKLVKEEYEVVAEENDEAYTSYAADEDDFELLSKTVL